MEEMPEAVLLQGFQRMFTLHNYQELRRRLMRRATRALLREPLTSSRSVQSVPRANVRRVLVCRPNHRLGNLLLLTPLIKELQHVFPAADVDIVLAGEEGAGLFRTFRNVGHIYTLSRRMIGHPLQTARIALQLRRANYDLAIDPCEGSQSSRWLIGITNAPHVIGDHGEDDYRAVSGHPAPRHMAKWPVYLLRRAIAACSADEYPALDIKLAPGEHQRGQQILSALTSTGSSLPRVIGVFADARGAKRYAEDWWIRFIEALRARAPGFTVVEIAPPDGRSRLSSHFPSFFSPDIREVAAVISRMACFISADCGVMHLACASGTPTFGLFSVTDIAQYTPYGHGSCAIDTNGKSPEEVARLAATMMPATQADSSASPLGRATNPAPMEGMVSLGAAESGRRNRED